MLDCLARTMRNVRAHISDKNPSADLVMVSCRIRLLGIRRRIATEFTENTEILQHSASVFSVTSVAIFVFMLAGAQQRPRGAREGAHA